MKIWLRRALIAVAVLLVLLIAVVAVLVSTFDPNRYKGLAIDWMKAHHQRTLAIDGPIRLSVFPRLEVQVSAVSLSEAGRSERFAAVEEAALAVQILPLLSRQLVVDRVLARGVSVVMTRDAKGVRNIDDLLAAGTAPAASTPGSSAPAPAGGGQPLRFDVSRIELADLKATIRDEQVPLHGDVVLESLVTGHLADKLETPVDLKLRFALQQPVLKGSLSGSMRLTPDLAAKSARLAGMKITYQGDAPGASGIDATIKGTLAYDGAKASVQASDLDLSFAATVGAIKIASSSVKADSFGFDPARKALTLAKLQVRVAGEQAKERFALALDWPNLAIAGTALQGSALSGEVSVSGTHTLNGKFQSAAPSGSFDLLRVPGVVLALDGKSGAQAIEGKLSADLLLRSAPAFIALEKLALQARLQTPGLQPLALDLGGTLSASAQEAQWQLSGKLNTNQFNTDGLARLTGKVPSLKAQARFDTLDVNKLLGTPQEAQAQASAPATAAAGDTPVNLQGLEGLQAQVALRAGSLMFKQYRVDDAQLEATLDAGVLKVAKLQGQSWGGHIEASGFADARASKLGVQLAASGVNINALLKDVAAKDLMEGTGRVTADLTTTGKTVGELRSHLAGQAAMQLRDGAIKGVNLAKSLRRAKAKLGGADQDTVEKATQTEKTDFSELSASFQIADGIAKSTDLDAKSPFLRLGGAGSADIGQGRIDYTARATVTNTSKGQEGAELDALRGLTVPVQLSGPFEAIAWKIQWSAIASSLAKAKVGDKLREQEDKLKDKLKDKLGIKPAAAAASAASSPAASPKDAAKDKLKNKLKGLLK